MAMVQESDHLLKSVALCRWQNCGPIPMADAKVGTCRNSGGRGFPKTDVLQRSDGDQISSLRLEDVEPLKPYILRASTCSFQNVRNAACLLAGQWACLKKNLLGATSWVRNLFHMRQMPQQKFWLHFVDHSGNGLHLKGICEILHTSYIVFGE